MPSSKKSAAKLIVDNNDEAASRVKLRNNVSLNGVVSPKTAGERLVAFDKRIERLELIAEHLHEQIALTTVLLKDLLKKVYATTTLGVGVKPDTSSSTSSATQPAE